MPSPISSRRVVVVSFLVDLIDVGTNLVVALLTGSAVVFAELAQGLADSAGSALLVIGERRAARVRDAAHPFGYAREAFFWALLSAVVMLVIGAGLSGWRGYEQLVRPQPLENSALALAVLVLAILTNGYAVSLSARKLASANGGMVAALRNPSRPLVKGALLRDVVGTTTSVVGLVALLCYESLGMVVFDAAGALVAAVMMLIASFLLMEQARALIAGRSLPESDLALLRTAILGSPQVVGVNQLAAVYAGATEVLVDTDLDLAEGLLTMEVEAVLDDVESRARAALPEIGRVRILLNSPEPLAPRGQERNA